MKKIILLILLILPIIVNANQNEEIENKHILAKTAKASILMEVSTGKILHEHNIHEKLAPASMTKIMTLLLIMEDLKKERITLEDEVLITPNAASMGGSQVFLEAGSKIKFEDLIKAIAIASANDASIAVSEALNGTHETFVARMNDKCKAIGCKNTNFINSHGLDAENHYSTAYDMALISRELLKYEKVLEYTNIYEEYLNKPDGSSTWMVNTNRLIRFYSGLDGLKTGFTSGSGYCLAATAKRNNMRLISVIMKEATPNDRNNSTIELLNYGFGNYKVKTILDTKHDLGQIEIFNGKTKTASLKLIEAATNLENISEEKKYTYQVIAKPLKAPVHVGDIVGYLEVYEAGKLINKFDITVKETVLKANIWDLYKRNLNKILRGN